MEINKDMFESDLGSGVIKKRVARNGQGKRSGFRILLAFKRNDRIIFMLGFAKNEQENITKVELIALKHIAKQYLSLTNAGLEKLIQSNILREITL